MAAPVRLPRLQPHAPLVTDDDKPHLAFTRFWNEAMTQIEANLNAVFAAQGSADGAQATADAAKAVADALDASLNVAPGEVLTVNKSMTLDAAADGETLNIGTGGTLGSAAFTAASAYVPEAPTDGSLYARRGSDASWQVTTSGGGTSGALLAANNLSDLTSVTAARTNLGVSATGADTTYLKGASNLSDLTNATTARGNLGLGNVENKSSATIRGEITSSNVTTALTYTPLNPASNLSDVANVATARSNLGVSASGADTAYVWRTNNLSDLTNAGTARTNLGLGTAAVKNTGTSGNTVPLLDGANTFSGATTIFNGLVGIGMTPVNILDITQDINNFATAQIKNPNAGSSAGVAVSMNANVPGSGASLLHFGSGWSTSGINRSDGTRLLAFGAGGLTVGTSPSQPVYFATNSTERARITADGFFKASNTGVYTDIIGVYHDFSSDAAGNHIVNIKHSHATNPYGIGIYFGSVAPNNGTNRFVTCQDTVAARCQVLSNGGIANYSGNNVNLSDATLKEDINPYTPQELDSLEQSFKAVQWCRYKYKDQTHSDWNHGYLAQDVATAFAATAPELVEEIDIGTRKEGGPSTLKAAVYATDLTNISHALLARALNRIAALEARLGA